MDDKPYPYNVIDNINNPTWKGTMWSIQTLKDCVEAALAQDRKERETNGCATCGIRLNVDDAMWFDGKGKFYCLLCGLPDKPSDPLSARLERLAEKLGCFHLEFHPGTGWSVITIKKTYWSKTKDVCGQPIGHQGPPAAVDAALKEAEK